MPKTIITAEIHETIVDLHDNCGFSYWRIGQLLGIHHRSIYYDISRRKTRYLVNAEGGAPIQLQQK